MSIFMFKYFHILTSIKKHFLPHSSKENPSLPLLSFHFLTSHSPSLQITTFSLSSSNPFILPHITSLSLPPASSSLPVLSVHTISLHFPRSHYTFSLSVSFPLAFTNLSFFPPFALFHSFHTIPFCILVPPSHSSFPFLLSSLLHSLAISIHHFLPFFSDLSLLSSFSISLTFPFLFSVFIPFHLPFLFNNY